MALRASPVVRGFLNDTQHSLPRWARALLTVILLDVELSGKLFAMVPRGTSLHTRAVSTSLLNVRTINCVGDNHPFGPDTLLAPAAGSRMETSVSHTMPSVPRSTVRYASPDETPWTRYTKDMSSRSPPPPMLAGVGVAHKISENHYYTRDVKRAVRPVFIVGNTANTPLTITAPAEGEVGPSESTIQNASLKSGPVFTGRRVKWSAGEPTPRMGESAYDDYGGLR